MYNKSTMSTITPPTSPDSPSKYYSKPIIYMQTTTPPTSPDRPIIYMKDYSLDTCIELKLPNRYRHRAEIAQ